MRESTCSIEQCGRPIRNKKRSWCNRHYLRWKRHGDPLTTRQVILAGTPLEERLWPRVNRQGPIPAHRPDLGPCWLWTGWTNNNGYGCIGVEGREQLVHRVVYNLLVGPIPQGLEPDHLCRTTICVKAIPNEQGPAHLEPVTHRENMQRGIHAQRTHCIRGHPYNETNTYWTPAGRRRCRACAQLRRAR